MESVYEAAGGDEGLIRLAEAWHARVMADEAVSRAFSHGFHPQHSEPRPRPCRPTTNPRKTYRRG